MLFVDVYDALLCRGERGPLTRNVMRRMLGAEEHPCIRYVEENPGVDYYALNNFASMDLLTLPRVGHVHLPEGFSCQFYQGDHSKLRVLDKPADVTIVGVMHKELSPGVFEPWAMFSMESGKQGQFSLNTLMRSYLSQPASM